MIDLDKPLARIALVAIAVAVIVGLLWLSSCTAARTAKTEAKLATGMVGAAIDTARDAGNVASNIAEMQDNNSIIVKDTGDALTNAANTSTAVDAGLVGLRRASGDKR